MEDQGAQRAPVHVQHERHEAHLAFLTVSSERDTASVLTPAVRPQDELSVLPRDTSDVQDLGEPDR